MTLVVSGGATLPAFFAFFIKPLAALLAPVITPVLTMIHTVLSAIVGSIIASPILMLVSNFVLGTALSLVSVGFAHRFFSLEWLQGLKVSVLNPFILMMKLPNEPLNELVGTAKEEALFPEEIKKVNDESEESDESDKIYLVDEDSSSSSTKNSNAYLRLLFNVKKGSDCRDNEEGFDSDKELKLY